MTVTEAAMRSTRSLWNAEASAAPRPATDRPGGILVAALSPIDGRAQDKVLNLYSARHYQTDDALYDNFTEQTGHQDRTASNSVTSHWCSG